MLLSRRYGRTWVGFAALVASLVFAAWAYTRTDARERAEKIYQRVQDPEALAQALRLSLDQLDRRPWDRQAARLAALCYSRLDFPDLAEPYYARAPELDLEDALVRAYAILRSNDRDRAIEEYQTIARRWPKDPRALRTLGGIYLSRRQYEEGLAAAKALAQVPGGELDGHRLAGTLQNLLQVPEESVSEFEKVLQLDPDLSSVTGSARVGFWAALAQNLLALGQAERAIDHLTTELARRGDPVLRTLLGKAYFQIGDFARARECWERSIEVEADSGIAWLELGRLELAENHPDKARIALEHADRITPNDRELLFSLRTAYQRLGMTDEAEAARKRAEASAPKAPETRGMGAPADPDNTAPTSPAGGTKTP